MKLLSIIRKQMATNLLYIFSRKNLFPLLPFCCAYGRFFLLKMGFDDCPKENDKGVEGVSKQGGGRGGGGRGGKEIEKACQKKSLMMIKKMKGKKKGVAKTTIFFPRSPQL